MYKTFNIFILLSLALTNLSGQSLRYKDVYASLKTSKDFEVYQLLLAFQKQEPQHANTYYQLGIINQRWMRQYDPFLKSDLVKSSIDNASLYLPLCLRFLDEKEARKNEDYYQNVKIPEGKKGIEIGDIIKDIQDRIQDVEQYGIQIKNIDFNFIGCVKSYNLCIRTFNDINQKNSRLKDLYFIKDPSLAQELEALKNQFDSTIFYLNGLKKALVQCPIGNYNPEYKLIPIDIYRLHGLTSVNFLNNKISLWDFGSWYDSFKKTINTDIKDLFNEAKATDIMHTRYIGNLRNYDSKDVPANYVLNPLTINKFGKYDFKSPVPRLFIFHESKIARLEHNAVFKQNDDSLSRDFLQNHPEFYFKLIDLKSKSDSLLNVFRSYVTPESIQKYSQFFNERYNGYTGTINYIESQNSDNVSVLSESLNKYKVNVLKALVPDTSKNDLIPYKNSFLKISVINPDLVKGDGYFTFNKTIALNGLHYLTGSLFQKNSIPVPFVAVLDNQKSIKWIKTYKKGTGAQYGLHISSITDGIVFTITEKTSKGIKNYILTLDIDGNIKSSKDINVPGVLRSMQYDDINQSFLFAAKGTEFWPYTPDSDSLRLFMTDLSFNIKWQKKCWFDGYLSNILKINDQLYIYGSYNKLTGNDSTSYVLGDSTYNCFLNVIDAGGNWNLTKVFKTDASYYPLKTVKINSDYVEIISVKDIRPDILVFADNSFRDSQPFYLITTSKGEVYFQH
jgi:hypothetical protein